MKCARAGSRSSARTAASPLCPTRPAEAAVRVAGERQPLMKVAERRLASASELSKSPTANSFARRESHVQALRRRTVKLRCLHHPTKMCTWHNFFPSITIISWKTAWQVCHLLSPHKSIGGIDALIHVVDKPSTAVINFYCGLRVCRGQALKSSRHEYWRYPTFVPKEAARAQVRMALKLGKAKSGWWRNW